MIKAMYYALGLHCMSRIVFTKHIMYSLAEVHVFF